MDQVEVQTYQETPESGTVDRLEGFLAKLPQADMPLTHRFTPGLYVREIFMPKDCIVISKIHKTEHPFVIIQGSASVWNNGKVEHLKAPHVGITKPGARRLLYIHEDCRWLTFHPTDETDVDKIEEQIILKRPICEDKLLTPEILAQLKDKL